MPEIVKKEVPDKIRPFRFYGLDLQKVSSTHYGGECPFCGKQKFSVEIETGRYRCFVCATGTDKGGGNVFTFIRSYHAACMEVEQDYDELMADRGLLHPETLPMWGVVKSILTDEWLLPSYSVDGKIANLYRWRMNRETGKMFLQAPPGLAHGLYGVPLYNKKCSKVVLDEGVWDAMVLWETLRSTKEENGEYTLTGNEDGSLLGDTSVLATPSCNVFKDDWMPLFTDKQAIIAFDNDHYGKNPKTGAKIEPAAWGGARRVVGVMAKSSNPPSEITLLRWHPKKEFDPELKHGWDVRDELTSYGDKPIQRSKKVSKLLHRIQPIPADWIHGRSEEAKKTGSTELQLIDCERWSDLRNAWRLSGMRWNEGLDRALSVMLASIASTKQIGDQLWVKIISPPSCLDASVNIHDPVDGTTKTVDERWNERKQFFVYTKKDDGSIGISEALPPQKMDPAPMYEVTFASGRKISTTAGHRFWNGETYVSLEQLASLLQQYGAYPLPTIEGFDLSTRTLDALRSKRTTGDCRCDCSACFCLYGEQPLRQSTDDLNALPSPYDVRACSLDKDGDLSELESKCNRRSSHYGEDRSYDRRSSFRVQDRAKLSEGVSSLYVSADNYESHVDQLEIDEHIRQSFRQKGRDRQQRQFSRRSILCDDIEFALIEESHSLETGRFQEELQHQFEDDLLDTVEHSVQLDHEANRLDVSWRDASQHPLREGTFEEFQTQRSSTHKLQLSSCLSCTDRRLDDDASYPTEQPTFTSINRVNLSLDKQIVSKVDAIVKVEFVGIRPYYDFHVPETQNYWAEGVFHHNSGKSVLCEALSTCRKYIVAKSSIRGFHSGFKTDREGEEDHSLIAQLQGKSLILKDGDTLLQAPNLTLILAEARDIYDRVSRTHYRHGLQREYEGINMTFILCGTDSLRSLDSSELGERFLDCVVIDKIDEDEEDTTAITVALRSSRGMKFESNGEAETQDTPEMTHAKQLTGGYVKYLRENATRLYGEIVEDKDRLLECTHMGKFVAFMRARPSDRQKEKAQREMSYRLVSVIVRLANSLAVVLNRETLDDEVMRRVRETVLNTARGRTLELCRWMYEAGDEGQTLHSLSILTGHDEPEEKKLLKFLRRIGAVEAIQTTKGVKSHVRWRLSKRMKDLYKKVVKPDDGEEVDV